MSAQVINALRKRADTLEAEYRAAMENLMRNRVPGQSVDNTKHWLAAEFRALADVAEGREPS